MLLPKPLGMSLVLKNDLYHLRCLSCRDDIVVPRHRQLLVYAESDLSVCEPLAMIRVSCLAL